MEPIFGTTLTPRARARARIVGYTVVTLIIIAMSTFLVLLRLKEMAYDSASLPVSEPMEVAVVTTPIAFPVSVDPERKEIIEDPTVDTFLREHVASNASPRHSRLTWYRKAVAKLALFSWYQNLASPMSRILVVESGERKEQVVDNFGDILKWDTSEREEFLTLITSSTPVIDEGKFFPANYVVSKDATPADVAPLLLTRFNDEVLLRYTDEVRERVPLEDALTLASLLEREAYDFNDMRQISGVIWNRLFADMHLQIDATLQYVKGENPNQPWWPRVVPNDKYIESPYNTYENAGLPPAPIANPSLDAIVAALNPRKTDCMYYFHDREGEFHCTPTYEEHVALLKQYYGRGK